jgi:hypothetical protein
MTSFLTLPFRPQIWFSDLQSLLEWQARWQSANDRNEVKTRKDKNRCNIRTMTQQSQV